MTPLTLPPVDSRGLDPITRDPSGGLKSSYRRGTRARAALLTIVGLAGIIGCGLFLSSDSRKLNRAIAHGDSAAVITYLASHLGNRDTNEVLRSCIQRSIKLRLSPVLRYLELHTLAQDIPIERQRYIVAQFAEENVPFNDTPGLLESLRKTSDPSVKSDEVRLLSLAPFSSRRAAFNAAKEKELGDSSDLEINRSRLNDILDIALMSSPEFRDSIVTVRASEDQSSKANERLETAKAASAKNQDALAPLKGLATEAVMQMSGYVVGEHSHGVYEIVPDFSSQHALLMLFNTEFTSRGHFDLQVQKSGEMPEQLREELGGFSQMWTVYVECDYSCAQRFASGKAEAERLVRERDDLDKEETMAEQNVDHYQQKLALGFRSLFTYPQLKPQVRIERDLPKEADSLTGLASGDERVFAAEPKRTLLLDWTSIDDEFVRKTVHDDEWGREIYAIGWRSYVVSNQTSFWTVGVSEDGFDGAVVGPTPISQLPSTYAESLKIAKVHAEEAKSRNKELMSEIRSLNTR